MSLAVGYQTDSTRDSEHLSLDRRRRRPVAHCTGSTSSTSCTSSSILKWTPSWRATGRKAQVQDAVTGRIRGGASSGKGFFKVNCLSGMAARRLALESLVASDAAEALVTRTCPPGGDRPARVNLALDGRQSETRPVGGAIKSMECRGTKHLRRPNHL